ncbi:MAG TPA: HEAT repeat domain-containing protein [Opitutaceae bacterium]|nr:HEAT repeat domain-containing protein [Opitutaceae bacterium]
MKTRDPLPPRWLLGALVAMAVAVPASAAEMTEPGRAALRAARTVRIEVEQRFVFATDDGEPPAGRPELPISREARRVCELAGLRVIPEGTADVVLRLDLSYAPEEQNYERIGRQFAGATVSGEAVLASAAGPRVVQEVSFEYEAPRQIRYRVNLGMPDGFGPHPDAARAPYERLLPGVQEALLKLATRVWGDALRERVLAAEGTGAWPALAAIDLAERGGPEFEDAVPKLAECLKSDSPEVRAAAAWALGTARSPAALEALLGALDEPGRWPEATPEPGSLADEEAESFAFRPTDYASDIFQYAFAHEQRANQFVYGAVLEQARARPSPALAARLVADLRAGKTADRRAAAAILLGVLKAEEARDSLAAAVRDSSFVVRGCAVRALGQLSGPAVADALFEASLDEAEAVRRAAEEEVRELPEELARQVGAGSNATGGPYDRLGAPNPLVRWSAAEALPAPTTEAQWETLRTVLTDRFPLIRRAAAERLASFPDVRPARPAIVALLRDRDPAVRASAVAALARMTEPGDLDRVLPLADDEDAEVRAGAMEALGQLQDARAVRVLIEEAADGEFDVRLAAADALVAHTLPDTSALIIAAIGRDPADPDRWAPLLDVLARRRDPRTVEPMIEWLAAAERQRRADDEDVPESPWLGGLLAALHELTGQEFEKAEDWRRWRAGGAR